MEIRARYVQVGTFTLGVMIATFTFVYWLNNAGGLRNRVSYSVRFEGSVSGLLRGSAVLFNGIRVGEVSGLELDPAQPRQVLAMIAVDRATPIRADTNVTIDFQGIAGAPVVALAGGTSDQPLHQTKSGVPLLIAESTAGQSMSMAARDVLRRFDGILAENAKPLHTMITSLDTFAAALARNSDRLDGIIAGLERMTGGAARTRAVYDLGVPPAALALDKVVTAHVVIPDPTALSVLDSDKIQARSATGAYVALADAQWSDLLPKVLQSKILRSLEDAGLFSGVSRPLDGFAGDFQLMIDIRKFEIAADLAAQVELGSKLLDSKGRIVATRVFRASRRAESMMAPPVVNALDQAFAQTGSELVGWATRTIAELGAPKTVGPKKTLGG